jgi:hypothetical protein
MKRLFVILLITILFTSVYAQNAVDALRYSNVGYGGSSRFTAMGGAFGAIGADFSTISTNPAGLGLFKSSEFTVTPSLYHAITESKYLGNTTEDDEYNFNIQNAGIVLTAEFPDRLGTDGWRNVQFGFGMNRLLNFNNSMYMNGFNENSSLLTGYTQYANDNGIYTNSPEELAYRANLLFYDSATNQYYCDMPDGGVQQLKSIYTEGSMNEVVMGLAANYSDKLYLGISIGFPYFRYYQESAYEETDVDQKNDYFKSLTLREQLETTGSGINIKAGMIFRVADWIRLGAAYHSPTFFTSMKDSWRSNMQSEFDSVVQDMNVSSPYGEFDYELTTPQKLLGSVAFVLGQSAIVSAEYQYVDYSSAKMRPNADFIDVNSDIKSIYKAQNIFKFGAEYRYSQFSFRGGYAMYDSPFADNLNDGKRTSISFGLGFKEADYYLDCAFVTTKSEEDYYLYYAPDGYDQPVSTNKLTANSIMLTLGYKF